MKIRANREIIVCIEIKPSELRSIADRIENGGAFDDVIHVSGNVSPKESIDLRFMLPLSEKIKRIKHDNNSVR